MTTDTFKPIRQRVEWVDFAKGICIILVVLLNTTHGVQQVTGAVTVFDSFNVWARPFRMPDFFFIAGLFLMRRIDRPWRSYLDTKVVHFLYFYAIWMTIWYVVRLPQYTEQLGTQGALLLYLKSYVEPLGSLWFIYMLSVFFVAAKLTKALPVWLVFGLAALLHSLQINTGSRVIDEFSSRFVYFYAGYVFAPHAFAVADYISRQKGAALIAGLTIWAVLQAWLVNAHVAELPIVSLGLGFIGTGAVVTAGVLLAKTRLGAPVRFLGANTLTVFLSYFLFSVATRIILLKSGMVENPTLIIIAATVMGIVGPVILHAIARRTPLGFLFHRPDALRIAQTKPRVERAAGIADGEKIGG
jgi:uncharacterized membrane protein YcfT